MRTRPRPDRIASILREIQADLQAGLNLNQACLKGGIGLTTYDRWKALRGRSRAMNRPPDAVHELRWVSSRPTSSPLVRAWFR
jgi:putative transposase